jgi:hypothetical protein
MTLRLPFAFRKLGVPALAVAAAMGWIGYAVACGWVADPPPAGAPIVKEGAKPNGHPPIVTVRDRMLQRFHGGTTDLFIGIPGFGMGRMPSLYKYVPFELPDLSTNDVEIQKEIAPPRELEDVFARSLAEFRKSRTKTETANSARPDRTELIGYGLDGVRKRGLQLRLLDLVGLTNPDGPVVYSGGKAFEIQWMTFEERKVAQANLDSRSSDADRHEVAKSTKPLDADGQADAAILKTRPLDIFEIAGVAELRQGKDIYIRHKGNAIRMLGALRATTQCLECHSENKNGDLLGAFSYTFVDTNKAAEKELKGRAAK